MATAAVNAPVVDSKPTVGFEATDKILPSIAVTATIKTLNTKKSVHNSPIYGIMIVDADDKDLFFLEREEVKQ